MKIKPKIGYVIYDPYKKDRLPAEGRIVPDGDLYWQRLINDGDVVIIAPFNTTIQE